MGFAAEQIIRSLAVSLRSTPSSVTNGVPSSQVLTTIRPPSIFAHIKTRLSAGNDIEHATCHDPAKHLGHDVGQHVGGREAATGPEPDGHGRVKVATRDMTDGIGHGQHGQTERQGDAQQADPHIGEGGSQHGAPAASQYQLEGSHKFSSKRFHSCLSHDD
jgi:hypothetical protein